jgi:hypothetical protein
MVLALVLLPALSGVLGGRTDAAGQNGAAGAVEAAGLVGWLDPSSVWVAFGLTLVKVAAFVGLMLIIGRRVIPWVLHIGDLAACACWLESLNGLDGQRLCHGPVLCPTCQAGNLERFPVRLDRRRDSLRR